MTKRNDTHYCLIAVFYIFSLVIFALVAFYGNIVPAHAQAQVTAKPTPTPKTKQEPKLGASENTQPPTTTGTIKGRVVSDDGRPVTNAVVVTQAGGSALTPRATRVDLEGQFVFDDLPAGAYLISATAPGYIDQSSTLGDSTLWPRHLLGTQLKITMIKGGVITGTVTNSIGEPVVGVPVNAMSVSGPSDTMTGNLGLGTGTTETDDRGIYRIYGLLPGQYTVTAGGGGPFGQYVASGYDLDVPTFYPSTTRDAAVPVNVLNGQETTGIDIKYRGLEGHSISGVVTGVLESSLTFSPVTILLSNAGTASILSLAIASNLNQSGVFSFGAVGDGEYDLLAMLYTGPTNDPLIGTRRVTVRGSDVTGIELKLTTLASIAGTIVLDPIKPEDKCDNRASEVIETAITAPRDDPKKSGNKLLTLLIARSIGTLNAKGEFTIVNLEPSKYRLGITLPTDAWYVREIIPPSAQKARESKRGAVSQRPGDAWQGVITIKSGERISPVKIMIGQDAAGLNGRVIVTPEIKIPEGLRVHLIPEERELVDNILRYSETLVNRDGSFAFTNLAPGRYLVIARIEPVTEVQSTPPRPVAWDPAARIKLRREAETANKAVELKPCQRLVDYTFALK